VFFALLQPVFLFSLGMTSYTPEIVAVIIAAQAFTRNVLTSGSIAIFAGLVVDLTAPVMGIFGLTTLSYLLIAVLIGFTVRAPHDSPWLPVLVAAAAPAVAVTIKALVVAAITQSNLLTFYPAVMLRQLLFGLLFATFLVPIIDWLDRPLYRDSLPLRVRT
jgi:hypothetical protein